MTPERAVLTPELCRAFAALVRAGGSVTVAARELGVGKASVSKMLRPLVRGCPPGVPRPWLVKHGRRFALTDEGRLMLPAAQEQVDRWMAFLSGAAADRASGLTVACGHEAAGGSVLTAAAAFRKTRPDVTLRVAVVRGRQRLEGVVTGQYDLALVTESVVAVREAARRPVVVESLAEDELVLACGARSAWAGAFYDPAIPVAATEVAGWALVLPEADSAIRKRWDELLRRKVPSAAPAVAIEVGGWRVLLGYVQAGFGVGLVPRSVAATAGTKVRTRPLEPAIRPVNRVSAVYLPDGANVELVRAFRATLT